MSNITKMQTGAALRIAGIAAGSNLKASGMRETIIKKGYSPYIGENQHWYEYDETITTFIDTGVQASGTRDFNQLLNKPVFGNGLKVLSDGVTVEIDAVNEAEQDNTKPITSAAVYTEIGNINALLGGI